MDLIRIESDADGPEAVSQLLRKKVRQSLPYLLVLTLVGLGVLFWATCTRETLAAVGDIKVGFLALAAALQVGDIAIGGWRNHILVRRLKPGVTPWLCLRAQVANEFACAVTPGQSGGGLAWLYILYRGGIAPELAVSVSVLVFLSTLICFMALAAGSFFGFGDQLSALGTGPLARPLFLSLQYSFVVCSGLFLLALLSLFMPVRMSHGVARMGQILARFDGRWCHALARAAERLAVGIRRYRTSCVMFLQQYRMSVVKMFLLTVLYYAGKLNLAYLVLLSLGVQADYVSALALLALLRLILYFSPTPGGSGIGDISIAALTSAIMPMSLVPVYTVLYRAFHLYLPASIGALVLFAALKRPGPPGEKGADSAHPVAEIGPHREHSV